MSTHATKLLDRARSAEAATLLARAFVDNPGYTGTLGFLPHDARLRALTALKHSFVDVALARQRAECVDVDGTLAGVALIAEPGQYPFPLLAYPRLARGALACGARGIRNLLRIDAAMQRAHPKEPHHYLFVLGVLPELQGRGVGRALLAALSARADEAKLPCYLETDTEQNVRLYESAGYDVIEELHIRSLGGLHMWCMRRDAR